LLGKLASLKTDALFSYSVIVVDNDSQGSAQEVIDRAKTVAPYDLEYHVEPERSISLARNMLVKHSTGDMVAFIDDDEFPDDSWLLFHYKALSSSRADGVLGPVIAHFDSTPPPWLIKSGLLERKRFRTYETLVDSRQTRTGNVLLRRKIFEDDEHPFDPAYGKSGGSDGVFFGRKMRSGRSFIWCDEACVYETVPVERQRLDYYIKRAFTRGLTAAWNSSFFSLGTILSMMAVLSYTVLLPFSLIRGYHACVRLLVKDCDHVAKLLGYAGIQLITKRPY
jgi:glycosyltransferase involved in cell wall biosynthesis